MVVIMNADATQADIEGVISAIEEKGLEAKVMEGAHQKIVGVIGDKTKLAATPLDAMHGVETTVAVLGVLMAALLVGMLVMAVVTARAYDLGDGQRPQAS